MARKKTETVKETVIETVEVTKKVTKYTKDVIIASKQYKKYKDLLTVVLDANKTYTLKEVDKVLKDTLASKIK